MDFLQCSDIVGWMTWRASGALLPRPHLKYLCLLFHPSNSLCPFLWPFFQADLGQSVPDCLHSGFY